MPKHLKKISEEVLHKNPWWEYKHDKYEMPNGEVGDYYYGDKKGTVLTIPYNKKDESLVLTLQYRYLMHKQSIEFPGGSILDDLTTLDSAKQELYEETGWVAEEWIKIGEFEPTNGLFNDTVHVFLAYVTEQHSQQLDPSEDIEVLYRRVDEVERMIRTNEIWCGQTIAAWMLTSHYLKT